MKDNSPIAPIASPHGEETNRPVLDFTGEGVQIKVRHTLWAIARYSLLDLISPLSVLLFALSLVFFVIIIVIALTLPFNPWYIPIFFMSTIWSLWFWTIPVNFIFRLFSSHRLIVGLSSEGIENRYINRRQLFPWSKLYWILEFKRNVWICSFRSGCFIPSESFRSHDECQQFMHIVRTLKTEGQVAWQPQWNGLILGKAAQEQSPHATG